MAENTKIEWCDSTWNPWEGCAKVSPGCANCYAEARNHRYGLDNWGKGKPRRRTSAANWAKPLKRNRGKPAYRCRECHSIQDPDLSGWNCKRQDCGGKVFGFRPKVFCASLADWLDEEVPIEWLADLLFLWFQTQNLDWLALTKRIENFWTRVDGLEGVFMWWSKNRTHEAPEFMNWLSAWIDGEAPSNVWIGCTVENQEMADKRIPELLKIPAKVRFLSCEPLLSDVDLACIPGPNGREALSRGNALTGDGFDSQRISWVISGGESGPNARPSHPDWHRSLRDQCRAAGVPYLFKQWGEWAPANQLSVRPLTLIQRQTPHCHGWTQDLRSWRIGKKAAGRLLDGREWNEFPNEQLQTP